MRFIDGLPIKTFKTDQLHDFYSKRLQRRECNISGTITMNKFGKPQNVRLTKEKQCNVILTVVDKSSQMYDIDGGINETLGLEVEKYGPDTVYSFNKDDRVLMLDLVKANIKSNPDIYWNDELDNEQQQQQQQQHINHDHYIPLKPLV